MRLLGGNMKICNLFKKIYSQKRAEVLYIRFLKEKIKARANRCAKKYGVNNNFLIKNEH
jgi:hypothetical protein